MTETAVLPGQTSISPEPVSTVTGGYEGDTVGPVATGGHPTGRIFDPLTGEVSLERYAFVADDRRYGRRRDHTHDRSTGNATRYTTPYVLFFRPAFRLLATSPVLRSGDLKILFLLSEQIDHKTELITVNYRKIGSVNDVEEATIRNAIGRLVKAGILIRPQRGQIGFNPQYVWCGGAGRREQLVSQQEEHREE